MQNFIYIQYILLLFEIFHQFFLVDTPVLCWPCISWTKHLVSTFLRHRSLLYAKYCNQDSGNHWQAGKEHTTVMCRIWNFIVIWRASTADFFLRDCVLSRIFNSGKKHILIYFAKVIWLSFFHPCIYIHVVS